MGRLTVTAAPAGASPSRTSIVTSRGVMVSAIAIRLACVWRATLLRAML